MSGLKQAARIMDAVLADAKPFKERKVETLKDKVIGELQALAGHSAVIASYKQTAWASITFSGTRHEVTMQFEGDDAVAKGEFLCEKLPDHGFRIPGQLVADAVIKCIDHKFGENETLKVEASLLLLEEGA